MVASDVSSERAEAGLQVLAKRAKVSSLAARFIFFFWAGTIFEVHDH